ncbi:MAG: F0F1 ATP synthase subunit delta [Rhodothermales bacterium]
MIIARRYAGALFEEAREQSRAEAVDRDVEMIDEILKTSRELVGFFNSPIISREKKNAVVEGLFGKRIDALTLQFLKLLIEKQREDIVPEIIDSYRGLRDEQLGVIEATARVAQPLSDSEEKMLSDALGRMTGKSIRLSVRIDPNLLGGAVVRVGDTVYDGSVRNQLELLREQLN